MENKTNFILKREWLASVANAKRAANSWRDANPEHWTEKERQENIGAYTKSGEQSLARAEKAPVKIVIYYEDGSTEVIE